MHGPEGNEGNEPLTEAHRCWPNLPNLHHQGSVTPEPVIVDPKDCACIYEAQRPVPDEGMSMHPEPWPSAGGKIEDSDTCTRVSVLLKGEQKSSLPSEGSEQHATPCTPQISPLPIVPLLPETLTCEIPRGEGTTPVQHATIKDLGEAGGALSAPSDTPGLPEGSECLGLVHVVIGMYEPGGALSAKSAVPAPTKETAGIELVGAAERAAATEP